MKLIKRILVSLLFLAFLVPLTASWQEETLAFIGTCDEVFDVDITVVGTGKNKQQALEDLLNKIEDEANAMCFDPVSCGVGVFERNFNGWGCEAVSIKTTSVNCKYSRRDRSWRCRTTIKSVECGCVEEDDLEE